MQGERERDDAFRNAREVADDSGRNPCGKVAVAANLPLQLGDHLLLKGDGGDVHDGVGVTGEHARAGCPVLGLLRQLLALRVMVAVDDGHLVVPRNEVNEVAHLGHFRRLVLVSGEDLVERVDDYHVVPLAATAARQLRGQ